MKIASIILLLLLFLGLADLLIHVIITPYQLESPLIPKSIIWDIQKNILVQFIIEFPFFIAALYFIVKEKYKVSLIISSSYILLSLILAYIYNPFI